MPCKSVCIRDVKLGIDPIHVWLGREQKMLGISQVLKPIKRQDLSEEGKNGYNGCRISWVRGTLKKQMKTSDLAKAILWGWNTRPDSFIRDAILTNYCWTKELFSNQDYLILTASPNTTFYGITINFFFHYQRKQRKPVVLLMRKLVLKIIFTEKNRTAVTSLSLLGTNKHKAEKYYFLSFTKQTYGHLI